MSTHPPGRYFLGFPPKFITNMQSEVNSVENMKRANPWAFSRPRMPATAPARLEEMNLIVEMVCVFVTICGAKRR